MPTVHFNEHDYLAIAIKNANLLKNMSNGEGRLSRTYKGEANDSIAFLDDYANVIDGLLRYTRLPSMKNGWAFH